MTGFQILAILWPLVAVAVVLGFVRLIIWHEDRAARSHPAE